MEVEDYERSSAAALRLQQWFRRDFQRLLRRRRAGQRIAAGCRQMLMVYVASTPRSYSLTASSFIYSPKPVSLSYTLLGSAPPGVC
jgi:hypothetical protein